MLVDTDGDLGRDAGLLAGVERVVDQLLDDRPAASRPGWWPVCAVSSFSLQKSSSRLVRKVLRSRRMGLSVSPIGQRPAASASAGSTSPLHSRPQAASPQSR